MKTFWIATLLLSCSASAEVIPVPRHLTETAVHITTGYWGKERGDCGPKGCYFTGSLLDVSLEGIRSGNYVLSFSYQFGVGEMKRQRTEEEVNPVRALETFKSLKKFMKLINSEARYYSLDSNSKTYSRYNHAGTIECFLPVDSTEYTCEIYK